MSSMVEKKLDMAEKGHGKVEEGVRPVNPFLWNFMIIFG